LGLKRGLRVFFGGLSKRDDRREVAVVEPLVERESIVAHVESQGTTGPRGADLGLQVKEAAPQVQALDPVVSGGLGERERKRKVMFADVGEEMKLVAKDPRLFGGGPAPDGVVIGTDAGARTRGRAVTAASWGRGVRGKESGVSGQGVMRSQQAEGSGGLDGKGMKEALEQRGGVFWKRRIEEEVGTRCGSSDGRKVVLVFGGGGGLGGGRVAWEEGTTEGRVGTQVGREVGVKRAKGEAANKGIEGRASGDGVYGPTCEGGKERLASKAGVETAEGRKAKSSSEEPRAEEADGTAGRKAALFLERRIDRRK